MSEKKVIEGTAIPATVETLKSDLLALGIEPGMILLVHSSLSALGWVCGGAVAVVLALEQVLGPEGTLVMPAHSGDLSDPSQWENPPVPKAWWPLIRATMPAYDKAMTPTRGMGAIVEAFRQQEGTQRSAHPQHSFCARGPHAQQIVDGHELNFSLGESSPLARIYDLEGFVLLLGVGHGNSTSMHLSECRAEFPQKKGVKNGAPIVMADGRRWVELEEIDLDSADFVHIGADFEASGRAVRQGKVARAEARLLAQRNLVDYVQAWMEKNRY